MPKEVATWKYSFFIYIHFRFLHRHIKFLFYYFYYLDREFGLIHALRAEGLALVEDLRALKLQALHAEDLGSKNGIKIDGKRILSGGASLHTGAKIQLAPKTILEFYTIALVKDAEPDDKTKIYD